MSEGKTIARISLSSRPPEEGGVDSDARLARMSDEIKRFGENLLAAKERLRDLRVRAAREEAKGTTGPEMGKLYEGIQAGVEGINALEGALERVITRAKQSRLSESDVQKLVALVRDARSARPVGITVPGGRTIYYYHQPLREPRSFAEALSDVTLDAVRRVDSYILGVPNISGRNRPFFYGGGSARGTGRGPLNFMMPLSPAPAVFGPLTMAAGGLTMMSSIFGTPMNRRPLMF